MSAPSHKTVNVVTCEQLVSINGWTFLSHDIAGWDKDVICFRSSSLDDCWAEWRKTQTNAGDEYELHVFNYQQDEESLKIEKRVKCMADIMRYIISFP